MWTIVMAVKPLRAAKSRLAPELEVARPLLALAFACDTAVSALACPLVARVIVVTPDVVAARSLTALGVVIVPERGGGLNAAFVTGAAAAMEVDRREGSATRIAAMTADLPCLRPADLTAALTSADRTGGRAFVPDAPGTGTTLLAAGRDGRLEPLFGGESSGRHAASGAAMLRGAGASLRRDVDTPEDLREAIEAGVGPYTRSVVRAARAFAPAAGRAA